MALKSLSSYRTEIFGSLLKDLYGSDGQPSWIYNPSSFRVNSSSSTSHIQSATAGGPSRAAPKPPGDGGHGIIDFLGNTVSNVEEIAHGIIPGLVNTVRHPIGTAEMIAKSYGQRYSPLIHGDFGEFAQQVYDHPVDFALDAATLATAVGSLGTLAPEAVSLRAGALATESSSAAIKSGVFAGRSAGDAAKAGRITRGMAGHRLLTDGEGRIAHVLESSGRKYSPRGLAGRAVVQSKTATAATTRYSKLFGGEPGGARSLTTRGGVEVPRGTWSSNPVIRVRQRFVALTANKFIKDTGPLSYFAESNRALRFQHRMARNGAEAMGAFAAGWIAVSRKLSKEEHQAIKILSKGHAEGVINPDLILEHVTNLEKQGKYVEAGYKETLMNPSIRALIAKPTPLMEKGIEILEDLHTENARHLIDRKIMTPAMAMESPYRFIQLMRGAQEVTHAQAEQVVKALDKRKQNGKQRYATAIKDRERMIGQLMHRGSKYPGERHIIEEQIAKLDGELHTIEHVDLPNLDLAIDEHKRVIKRSFVAAEDNPRAALQAIKDEIDAADGRHPFYYPDKAYLSGKDMHLPDPRGGGLGIPKGESLNRGQLMAAGQVLTDGTAITAKTIESSKKVLYSDLHQILLDESKQVGINEQLKPGWKYVRSNVRDKVPAITKANISEHSFHDAGFTSEDKAFVDDWTTLDPTDPRISGDGGSLRAIDPQTLKAVTGEFTSGASFLNKILLRTPLAAWRALILGWSPRFLVNNFVGNHMLYAMRVDPIAGIHSLAKTWHNDFASEKKARVFMGHARTPKELQNLVVAELFPSQLHGGFVGMQKDIRGGLRGSLLDKAHGPFAPLVQYSSEKMPRYALARYLTEQAPEFKIMQRSMGKSAHFEEVAIEMKRTGTMSQARLTQISNEIDDALGNYKDLTHFEKNVVRSLVPFYSWYKAILRITFTLPAKHPMKALLMARVGEVGSDINATRYGQDMPGFLRGLLPVGFTPPGFSSEDMQRHNIMTTAGVNPFETVAQMAEVGKTMASMATGGNPDISGNEAIMMTNPFLQAGIEWVSQKDILSGADQPTSPLEALASPFVNAPQVQMEQAFTGNTPKGTKHSLYVKNPAQYVWSFVGMPFKQVYIPTAHAMYHLDKHPPKYIKIPVK